MKLIDRVVVQAIYDLHLSIGNNLLSRIVNGAAKGELLGIIMPLIQLAGLVLLRAFSKYINSKTVSNEKKNIF